MKANKIQETLSQIKNLKYKKILFDGEWGIGKTKYSMDYVTANQQHAIYISLFGKKTINDVNNELYYLVIERISKLKKTASKLKEIIGGLDISIGGLSISIPFVQNMIETLQEELKDHPGFTIIIDDIERKHDSLHIKEIFGLVDSLTKIDNLSIVLIASIDHLEDDVKQSFLDYREKTIDRVYKIDAFSDDAPKAILGESSWLVVENITESLNVKNLRIFQKTANFYDEVINVIKQYDENKKVSNEDILRMCFAIILHVELYKNEKKLLKKDDRHQSILYNGGDRETVEYLCNHILKGSLENNQNKNIFVLLIGWYRNGECPVDDIVAIVKYINEYEESPLNFYSSEDTVLEVITTVERKIGVLEGHESIFDLIIDLNTALDWSEALRYQFKYSIDQLNDMFAVNIENNISLNRTLNEQTISNWNIGIHNKDVIELARKLNGKIKKCYYEKFYEELVRIFRAKDYTNSDLLSRFETELYNIEGEQELEEMFSRMLLDNEFVFPRPTGEISQECWFWSHSINELMKKIKDRPFGKLLYKEYINFIDSISNSSSDAMEKHRLRVLKEN